MRRILLEKSLVFDERAVDDELRRFVRTVARIAALPPEKPSTPVILSEPRIGTFNGRDPPELSTDTYFTGKRTSQALPRPVLRYHGALSLLTVLSHRSRGRNLYRNPIRPIHLTEKNDA